MGDTPSEAEQRRDAEARLEGVLAETGAHDPRAAYRQILRDLKLKSETDYRLVVEDFRTSVVRTIVEDGGEPLGAWLEFGCRLAELMSPGRDVVIDATGQASPFSPPASWRDLILHLPSGRHGKGMVVGLPPNPTPAQQAAVILLVEGRVRLPDA